ncbi:hypothetical protein [Halopelagius fulvigenes]|uniref:Major facilitator superfamily (MFS) profile domain-containing protein n=1 Tax=Halopelagius fulvigenes TaxID=1198324 RepID=A0ABD5TZH0_9EURY
MSRVGYHDGLSAIAGVGIVGVAVGLFGTFFGYDTMLIALVGLAMFCLSFIAMGFMPKRELETDEWVVSE